MEILKANTGHLDIIAEIYQSARERMANSGNPNQWVNGYPSQETILKDLMENRLFVCINLGRIVGCFVFFEGEDPTYQVIYHGNWLNSDPYAVIHRMAVSDQCKGVGSACMDWCLNQTKNIRIDTHEDNISMQSLLKKFGFHRCGIIKTALGDNRIAFQYRSSE